MSRLLANGLRLMGAIAAIASLAWVYPARSAAPASSDSNSPQRGNSLVLSESIDGFQDVSPSDPYFLALQSLVKEYKIDNLGFYDRTFRGDMPLTRGDFVIYFERAIEKFQNKIRDIDKEVAERVIEENKEVYSQAERERRRFCDFQESLLTAINKVQGRRVAKTSSKIRFWHGGYVAILKGAATEGMSRNAGYPGKGKLLWGLPLPDASISKSTGKLVWQSVGPNSLIAQITSITEVTDVSTDAPYYQSLQYAIERYGLNVMRSNGTFQGDEFITRGEFALYLNQMLEIMKGVLASLKETAYKDEFEYLKRYIEINQELDAINAWARMEAVKEALQKLGKQVKQEIGHPRIKAGSEWESPAFTGNRLFLPENAIAQVTSINEVIDVSPSDPYFFALESLIQRHEISSAIHSDRTFQADTSLTRGDFINSLVQYPEVVTKYIISPAEATPVSELVGNINMKLEKLEATIASLGGA
ncbi:MAG: S-layer homology domain-containing protein [Oscillatoria sp. SIO1A7]|nr:S-layer homology domain-containing protein [Oscillatoria sp. SIO1A7]